MKNINNRERVASEAVESILRGRAVTNESLVILAGEAKVCFAVSTAGWHYLEAIALGEEADKNRILAKLPSVQTSPDIASILNKMNKEQVIAYLGLDELAQLRAEAEAKNYWRKPN